MIISRIFKFQFEFNLKLPLKVKYLIKTLIIKFSFKLVTFLLLFCYGHFEQIKLEDI